MTDSFSGNMIWILLFCFLMEGICFLLDYDERWHVAAIALTILCLVVFVIYNQLRHPFLHEQQMSQAIFWIYLIGVGIVLYYLHKVRWGILFYLLVGNLITATAVFLQFGITVSAYVCFLIGTIGILLYQFYLEEISEHLKLRIQTTRYAIQSILLCIVALCLSLFLVYVVLIPLSLPTRELKLIQQLESMEIIHKVGVSTLLPDVDPSSQASGENQDQIRGNADNNPSENQEEDTQAAEAEQNQSESSTDSTSAETMEQSSNEKEKEDKEAIQYKFHHYLLIIAILLCITCVIASVVYKKTQRKRFLQELDQMSRAKAVLLCYNYFNRTLTLLKVRQTGSLTLREYARLRKKDTDPYICGEHDYRDLTHVYEKVLYGHGDVSEEEWSWFKEAYSHYHENIREEVGCFRYLLLFYRI